MLYRYDIHIKLRMKKSFKKEYIKRSIEYFMGVGDDITIDSYKKFFNARKMISIGITEQHKS